MSMSMAVLTALARGQHAALRMVLDAAGLPVADLDDAGRQFYRFDATSGGGLAGLEGTGADRLLRSVLVDVGARHRGLGRLLVNAIDAQARAEGAQRLHQLTTTAAPFFARCGFAPAERKDAPPSIATSHEFTRLCPATAAYFVKSL